MPYITKEFREEVKREKFIRQPGDAVFLIYEVLVKEWKHEPRFTTAFNLLHKRQVMLNKLWQEYENFSPANWETAFDLAYMEFYRQYVGPYEDKKKQEYGDVEV